MGALHGDLTQISGLIAIILRLEIFEINGGEQAKPVKPIFEGI